MKLIIGLLSVIILLLESCGGSKQGYGNNTYRIYGEVANTLCDGATIFLVPVDGPATAETVDSAVIENRKFYFEGTIEKLAVLRLQMPQRVKFQELLLITEPGDINVWLDGIGSVTGTKQNDSLQVWKNLTETYIRQMRTAPDSIRADILNTYKQRTIDLGHNIGENTTLGKFLLELYKNKTPSKKAE